MNILSGTVRSIRNAGSWAILRVCHSYRQPVASVVTSPNDLRCYSTTKKHNDDGTDTNTIDNEEVALFSRHADEWWNETGEFAALHSLNELRVPLVRDALLAQNASSDDDKTLRPTPLAGFKILDVGCGGGILSEPLARLGANVTGIDASEQGIKVAQWHKTLDPEALSRLNYRCAAIENIATAEAETYDGLVASEIIEHVIDQRGFVAACCQLVKPGGSVFFTTLSRTYLSYALGIVAAERILRIVPAGAHDWNKFILPDELQDMISQNGMNVRLVHGMTFNPLTSRWSWISDTSINYAIHAVKPGKSASSSDSSSSSDSDSG